MALIYSENLEKGLIGLWKITEEEDELYSLADLSPSDKITCSGFKASQRRKEWLATRILIKKLTGIPPEISYHPDGRPYLENSYLNISISHTKGYAAVILHEKLIPGIDIELETRSAEKVAQRILSPAELEFCTEEGGYSNKKLLIHWCAKETVFKMVPAHNVSYLKQIQIFLNKDYEKTKAFSAQYFPDSGSIPFNLFFKQFEDLIIIWGWMAD